MDTISKILKWLAILIILSGIGTLAGAFFIEPSWIVKVLFGSRYHFNPVQESQLAFIQHKMLWMGVYSLLLGILIFIGRTYLYTIFKRGMETEIERKYPLLFLFTISFISLYFELIFIRWISSEIRIFAFFKNIPLISAFFGLGLGCLLTKRKNFAVLFLPIVALLITTIGFGSDTFIRLISQAGATLSSQEEHLWGHMFSQDKLWVSALLFYGGVVVFFLWQVLCFIPIGQLIGKAFEDIEPLKAYSINIAGALSGILFYYILTQMHTPPYIWFSLGALPFIWFLWKRPVELIIGLALLIVSLFIATDSMFPRMWSPYNRLSLVDSYLWKNPQGEGSVIPEKEGEWLKIGYRIDVNDLFYMDITDFSQSYINEHPHLYPDLENYAYNLPYQLLSPKSVLVVGAGGGNDVAAALRHGAEKVDAVEIDPIIAQFGKERHPEKPYLQNNVQLTIDDARHYFNYSKKKYDLIVFGLLDSHSLVSTHSSIRLDNYVYTLESFHAAKKMLTPNGTIFVMFATQKKWMIARFTQIFTQVFGKKPHILNTRRGIAFVSGLNENYQTIIQESNLKDYLLEVETSEVKISTDDWPFMYMRENTISNHYLIGLAIMGILTIFLIRKVLPNQSFPGAAHFFWLGVAFLLLEIKSITQLALLWGSTWVVSAIVITTIMIMILCANFLVILLHLQKRMPFYILLFISIAISYFLNLDYFVGNGISGNILPTILICLPLFFAGIIFAISFKKHQDSQGALGWNLLGAFLGGVCEYLSLIFGFKWMALFATIAYLLSWIFQSNTKT